MNDTITECLLAPNREKREKKTMSGVNRVLFSLSLSPFVCLGVSFEDDFLRDVWF